jgi:hypothetical protein
MTSLEGRDGPFKGSIAKRWILNRRNERFRCTMTDLTPVLNALVVFCAVVGAVGILCGAYLFLVALPELPRYLRMKAM